MDMKKLYKGQGNSVGRPRNQTPSVKKCVCIPGKIWAFLESESERIDTNGGYKISPLKVMYQILERVRLENAD
jgi:hypothetical protein